MDRRPMVRVNMMLPRILNRVTDDAVTVNVLGPKRLQSISEEAHIPMSSGDTAGACANALLAKSPTIRESVAFMLVAS
jgi:hypothetical protein